MKTSSLIASALFGSLAIAAPFDRRALLTKTEVVVETEVVYVTVWEGQAPVAQATTTPAQFYEQKPASSTQPPAVETPAVEEKKPENPPAPAPPSSTPAPAPSSVYTPPPPPPPPTSAAPVPEAPKESPKPVENSPPPAPSAPAPSPSPAPETPKPETPKPGNGGGNQHAGDITVYNPAGGNTACGPAIQDSEFYAAISHLEWGNDVWGGEMNGNPWCGKKATVFLDGASVDVTIMDKCMGCQPGDIDITQGAWDKLTGGKYPDRFKGTWVSS